MMPKNFTGSLAEEEKSSNVVGGSVETEDEFEIPISYENAEEALLAMFIQDDDIATLIAQSGLRDIHFLKRKNKVIFPIILNVRFNKGVCNFDLVADQLEKETMQDGQSVLYFVGGLSELTRIIASTPAVIDLKVAQGYIDIIFEQFRLSKVKDVARWITSQKKFDESKIVDKISLLQETISDDSLGRYGLVPIDVLANDSFKRYKDRRLEPEKYKGIKTRDFYWVDKNKAIAKKRTCVVGARTSVGKCLHPDTLVWTSRGLLPIGEVFIGDNVLTKSHMHKITATFRKPISKSYKIVSDNGLEIVASPEHKFYIDGNWVESQNLKVGDILSISKGAEIFGKERILNAYWLGLLIGDGCLAVKNRISFINQDEELINAFKNPLPCYSGEERKKIKVITVCGEGFREFLFCAYGIPNIPLKSKDKSIPKVITCADRETQIEFIKGLFDTDGHSGNHHVEYSSASSNLIHVLQLLLLNFGILSSLTSNTIKGIPYYRIIITGDDFNLFHDIIGFSLLRKKTLRRIKKVCSRKKKTCFGKIKTIEELQHEEVDFCDLTVDYLHNYVANGMVTHNSILISNMITKMLLDDFKVLLFTPELDRREYADRLICALAGVDIDYYKDANIDDVDVNKIGLAKSKLIKKAHNLYIEDKGSQSCGFILNSVRKHMLNHQVDVVAVDYLQKLRYRGENTKRAITDTMDQFCSFGKDNDIAFIIASQLRRSDKPEPELSDLKESGDIENFADSVILLHRNSVTKHGERNKGWYKIAKNRQGSTTDNVALTFNELTLRFTENDHLENGVDMQETYIDGYDDEIPDEDRPTEQSVVEYVMKEQGTL